jgi:hypothetical protein
MPLPDTITLEVISPITTVELSPVEEIDSLSVNTIPEIDSVSVDNTDSLTQLTLEETSTNLVVQLSTVENTSPVQSVNGKTGHVTIDYPDINTDPVNHVKYVHNQVTISNNWEIVHNLGFFPNITVMDNSNRILETDVQYLNVNSVRIIMNTSTSGTAYLS